MFTKFTITKENADLYFYELAKEYKKKTRFPLEIILVGGGAILLKYNFRIMSIDYDGLFSYKDDYVKQCIYNVAEKLKIPSDWLNDDFIKSDSYTPKIRQYSTFYKTYSNLINVRVVEREYLVAMKLMSGRHYKHDLSDIVGIIMEENNKNPITKRDVETAITNLYGEDAHISDEMNVFLDSVFNNPDLATLYDQISNQEQTIRNELTVLEQEGVAVRRSNIKDVVKMIEDKLNKK